MGPNNVRALSNKAFALYHLGDEGEALYYFDRALESDPNDVDALGFKGLLLCGQSKSEEALYYFDRALEIDPANARSLTGKGFAFYINALSSVRSNDLENAIINLGDAIKIGGEDLRNRVKNEKAFDILRNDERFKEMIGD